MNTTVWSPPCSAGLEDGADAGSISSYLRGELPRHFGLESSRSLDVFIGKLMAWWSSSGTRETAVKDNRRDDPVSALDMFEKAEDAYWLDGYVASERLREIAVAGLVAGLDCASLSVLAGQPPRASADNAEL